MPEKKKLLKNWKRMALETALTFILLTAAAWAAITARTYYMHAPVTPQETYEIYSKYGLVPYPNVGWPEQVNSTTLIQLWITNTGNVPITVYISTTKMNNCTLTAAPPVIPNLAAGASANFTLQFTDAWGQNCAWDLNVSP